MAVQVAAVLEDLVAERAAVHPLVLSDFVPLHESERLRAAQHAVLPRRQQQQLGPLHWELHVYGQNPKINPESSGPEPPLGSGSPPLSSPLLTEAVASGRDHAGPASPSLPPLARPLPGAERSRQRPAVVLGGTHVQGQQQVDGLALVQVNEHGAWGRQEEPERALI